MKTLLFRDLVGNGATYALQFPESMMVWNVTDFLDFMSLSHAEQLEAGFLINPADPLHIESLRVLINSPASTLNAPVVFLQNDRVLTIEDSIDLSGETPSVEMSRLALDLAITPTEANLTEKNQSAFNHCRQVVIDLMDSVMDVEKLTICNGSVICFAELLANFDSLATADKLRFLLHVAETAYCAPFENYSKVFSGVAFRSGIEMLENISHGFGGVCAEKNGFFRFVCDILGLETFVVAGSSEPLNADVLKKTEAYIASGGELAPPAWYQHLIAGVIIDGEKFLVDTTNGNTPLLFLDEDDMQRFLSAGLRARMVYYRERLNLLELPRHIGDALFLINEFHLPNQCEEFIFKQGLGLNITNNLFIGVYFDWGHERSENLQAYNSSRAKQLHLPYPYFVHAGNLDAIPDKKLRDLLEKTGVALRLKYARPEYTGGLTFVIQPLFSDRWRRPRISSSILKRTGKCI